MSWEDGRRWGATCVSYQNVKTLQQKNTRTGESLSGAYLWARFLNDEDSMVYFSQKNQWATYQRDEILEVLKKTNRANWGYDLQDNWGLVFDLEAMI